MQATEAPRLVQFSKFSKFLWVCLFLGKNLPNFIYPVWKLLNLYCHSVKCPFFVHSRGMRGQNCVKSGSHICWVPPNEIKNAFWDSANFISLHLPNLALRWKLKRKMFLPSQLWKWRWAELYCLPMRRKPIPQKTQKGQIIVRSQFR